jgi:monofunctional biosynthetic peptidoglycan transglycosylase
LILKAPDVSGAFSLVLNCAILKLRLDLMGVKMNHCPMAKRTSTSKSARKNTPKSVSSKKRRSKGVVQRSRAGISMFFKRLKRLVVLGAFCIIAALACWVLAYKFFPIPTTPYMSSEGRRLGGVDYQWVALEETAPVLARAVVAAEDANFCSHWGLDLRAIRAAIEEGSGRGASTISQQVAKNAFLWQGRSWLRKAMEALLTPTIELVWSKQRIIEVYLNIAEFDEGVFGVEAASYQYFGIGPDRLSPRQAAQLAAILPSPKTRDAGTPSAFVRRRAAQIADGAATIAADGRSACFED